VQFSSNCVGEEPLELVNNLNNGNVLLLENLRFHAEEEGKVKDPVTGKKIKIEPNLIDSFRQQLSSYGDIFVNDAFGTSHRAHSSIVGTSHSVKASGLLLEKEIKVFRIMNSISDLLLKSQQDRLPLLWEGPRSQTNSLSLKTCYLSVIT
jgi:phosphoglycerate kinase